MSASERAAGWVVGAARALARRLPPRIAKALDDRIFGVIFQMTRVTNDAYGWRPPPPQPGGDATP